MAIMHADYWIVNDSWGFSIAMRLVTLSASL